MIKHNGKDYGVETTIRKQEGFDIITDDNGNPLYIKAKSTTTSVDLSNCTTLVELDLSDADIEDVVCGEYGNVNIRQCSSLAKVTWPTKMKYFATYNDGLYGCTSLTEIPTVTGYVNLTNTNIKEVTIGNRKDEGSQWWGNFSDSGCRLMKINKAWDSDEKFKIDVYDNDYMNGLPSFDSNYFYATSYRPYSLVGSYTDLNGCDNWFIDSLTYNSCFDNSLGCNTKSCKKVTINWTWNEGGDFASYDYVFVSMYALEDVYITYDGAGVPRRNVENLFKVSQNGTWVIPYGLKIHIPSSLLEAYKADETWADYKDYFVAI